MHVPAIPLDAEMTASAVLARLARHGIWLEPGDPGAKEWLAEHARRTRTTVEEAAKRLGRDPSAFAAAIRRQWGANVLWYVRPALTVLAACALAPPDRLLRDAVELHERDSLRPLPLPAPGEEPAEDGVVLDGGTPVAVSVARPWRARAWDSPAAFHGVPPFTAPAEEEPPEALPPLPTGFMSPNAPPAPMAKPAPKIRAPPPTAAPAPPPRVRAPPPEPAAPAPRARIPGIPPSSETPPARAAPRPAPVQAWPRIDAPTYVPAQVEFEVKVGLAREQEPGVSGGKVVIRPPAGEAAIDVDVHLLADGLDAPGGWSRRLRVAVADPASSEVAFRLVGRIPAGPEPVHLTMLQVRYAVGGTICGTASRPLVVGHPGATAPPPRGGFGMPWADHPAASSSVTLERDEEAPDLTIEIAKLDGNAASGRFACRLYSPHPLAAPAGPHPVDLGQDAKTFARACVVDELNRWSGDPLADNVLQSIGRLVAEQLPAAAFDALREVAARVAPEPPAVLVVSAEPYVPWELAMIDPPLDPDRPPYLGAQALVGRWIQEQAPASPGAGGAPARPRPPPRPPSRIPVQHMAVMVGLYRRASGLGPLPSAEEEGREIALAQGAVRLDASPQALKQLLDARIEHGVGGAEAVHFAGHGEFDPSRPDGSVLFLSNGKPLSSFLFRSACYGDGRQPLIFFNACMIGIGGEILGDMGGFPGNCLKGGFGGVLGALWAVDDSVAAEVALEFWERALPPRGAAPEPVGAVLRELRSRYDGANPASTWLAYAFYGHPRLTLGRA